MDIHEDHTYIFMVKSDQVSKIWSTILQFVFAFAKLDPLGCSIMQKL